MRVRTELESLRHILDYWAADLLLWIASYGGRFGPVSAPTKADGENDPRQSERVLLAAGLLRIERRRGRKGYMYQLLVDVRDPMIIAALAQFEEEVQREEAAWYQQRDQEARVKALQGAGQ